MQSMLTELGGAAPQTSAQPSAAAPSFDLSSVPLLKAVAEADEPGFTATREDLKRPELAPAVSNYQKLPELGLSLYGAQDGSFAVFNAEVFSGEEIKQFDAQGILQQVLPPVGTLLERMSTQTGGDKAGVSSVPQSGAPAPAPMPVAGGGKAAPSPAPIVRARAQANALDMKPPTKKPAPGSGSISQGLGRAVI